MSLPKKQNRVKRLPLYALFKHIYCVYSEKLNTVCPIDGEKAKHCLANSKEIIKSLSSLSETEISIQPLIESQTGITIANSNVV